MSKIRYNSIDMARGVSILLVAAYHANTTSMFNGLLSDLRMPLFFLLSGFLFSKKYITSTKLLIKNRVKTLLLPYFSAALLFYLFFVLRTIIDKDEFSLWRAFIGVFYGISPNDWLIINVSLWFLLCLFCAQIIFAFIMKIIQNISSFNQLLVFLSISIIGFFIDKIIYLPWSFDKALLFQIFVFVGYKIKEFKILNKIKPFSFVAIAMLIIFVGVTYISFITEAARPASVDAILMYIGGISGSIVILNIVTLLSSIKWISKTLTYIGRESLTILIFHGGLFIYATGVITNRIGFNIHWVIAWIISIIGSLIIATYIKKYPVANLLLNGKSTDKHKASNNTVSKDIENKSLRVINENKK